MRWKAAKPSIRNPAIVLANLLELLGTGVCDLGEDVRG